MENDRSDEVKLEPCPFCGVGGLVLLHGGPGSWYVKCLGCGATGDDGSRERAIEFWNRRVPTRAENAQVAEPVGWVLVPVDAVQLAADLLNLYRAKPGWKEAADALFDALAASPPAPQAEVTEGERFPVTLGQVHAAIDTYVDALVQRQHGGLAMDKAFDRICKALGRSLLHELDARSRAALSIGESGR